MERRGMGTQKEQLFLRLCLWRVLETSWLTLLWKLWFPGSKAEPYIKLEESERKEEKKSLKRKKGRDEE